MKRSIAMLSCLAFTAVVHAQRKSDTDFIDQKDAVHATGEQIYTHICQGCHMPDGRGAVGAGHYPTLASNPKLASSAYPVAMILNGRGAMPTFGFMLSDEQVADVVNYVRTHFGNAYADALKPEDVKAFRPPPAIPSSKEH